MFFDCGHGVGKCGILLCRMFYCGKVVNMANQGKKSTKHVDKTDSKNIVKFENMKKNVSKKSDVIKKDTGKHGGNSKQKNIDSKKTVQKNMKVSETDKVLDEKLMVENSEEKKGVILKENVNNSLSSDFEKFDSSVHVESSHKFNHKRKKNGIRSTCIKKNSSASDFRTSDVALLVLITCVISLVLGGLVAYRFMDKEIVDDGDTVFDAELQSFIKKYNYIVDNYYTEVNKKEILDAAFKAAVDSLGDAYSGFIDESESNNFDITLRGSYTGLGVEVVNDNDGNIVIYSIFKDSPAGRSDLQVGDILVRLNGKDVLGTATSEFTKIIQDSSNSEFTMVVRRETGEKTITIKKGFITLQSVVSKTFEKDGKKIGYLGVSIFAANTGAQFHTALENLEKEGIDGLVVDLRGNGGGHLFVVENMISEFLDSSHIIYHDESKTKTNKVYSTGSVTKTYPISILVNGTSASASEVMTAALMEEYGAKVVGTTTYGKGTVQELHEDSNGDEYKFTTKKWLTPKGNWINSTGIAPDYEIVLNEDFYKNPSDETDNQLQKAVSVLFE